VKPDRVPLLTAACDVVYYGFDETNPNARWSAPNKLYEAIAAGKPVLTGAFGEIGRTVEEAKCGLTAELHSAGLVAAALATLSSRETLVSLGSNARRAASRYCQAQARSVLAESYKVVCQGTS